MSSETLKRKRSEAEQFDTVRGKRELLSFYRVYTSGGNEWMTFLSAGDNHTFSVFDPTIPVGVDEGNVVGNEFRIHSLNFKIAMHQVSRVVCGLSADPKVVIHNASSVSRIFRMVVVRHTLSNNVTYDDLFTAGTTHSGKKFMRYLDESQRSNVTVLHDETFTWCPSATGKMDYISNVDGTSPGVIVTTYEFVENVFIQSLQGFIEVNLKLNDDCAIQVNGGSSIVKPQYALMMVVGPTYNYHDTSDSDYEINADVCARVLYSEP